jgi:hypothetical protein
MKLKTIYETAEEIPAGYEDLYTERNGKFELTAVEGVKTQADVDRVQSALAKERTDHKATKAKLEAFGDLDPETAPSLLTELEETKAQLEAIKVDGSIDETKLEPIIAARVKQQIAPLERDNRNLSAKLAEQVKQTEAAHGEVGNLKTTITTGNIERSIRDAAVEAKVISPAIGDAVMKGSRLFETTEDGKVITKDNVGVTPGLSPKEWLKDEQDRSPHWWPASVGGNSKSILGPGGNRTSNPWGKDAWNITKQGAFVREHGEDKARQMAEAAGVTLGATKPAAA